MRSLVLGLVVAVVSCQQVVVDTGSPYDMAPTVISPVIPPTIALTLDIPSDGDVANSLSIQQFVQPIMTTIEGFRELTYGGGIRRRVLCSSNTVLTIQPLGAVVVTEAGEWTVLEHNSASTVSPVTITGGLVASTRYWVYAYDDAGAINFTASTTGPDVGMRYMTGNTDYAYVSTFYTDTVPNVLTYTQIDDYFKYLNFGAGANRVLIAGSAVVGTAVSLAGPVPPQALAVDFKAGWSSAADLATVRVTTTNSPILEQDTNVAGNAFFGHSLADGLQVEYIMSTGASALTLWISAFYI